VNRKERRRQGARGTETNANAPTSFGADDALAVLTGRRAKLYGPSPEQPMAKGFVFSMALAEAVTKLENRNDIPSVARAVTAVYAFAEGVWASANARVTGKQLACAKGCAWCCYQQVSLTSYEAATIVDHVRRHWSAERREALIARLRERREQTRGLDSDAIRLKRLPCPYLEDDACSIHAVRPFRCRAYNSTDAKVCRWMVEHAEEAADKRKANALPVVFDGEAPQIFDDAQHAMAEGLAKGGIPYDHVELGRGTLIGFEDADALIRWLAGEDVFASARIGEKPR